MFATRAFTVAVAAALLLVNGAQGATVVARTVSPDPVGACNPPENGGHVLGSSCQFFSGVFENSPILTGRCLFAGPVLTCIV